MVTAVAEELSVPASSDGAFWAVFDGHGGSEAAKFAKLNLMKNIVYAESESADFLEAIRRGVAKTDADFIEWARENGVYSGTTVIAAFLRNRSSFSDSFAILSDWLGYILCSELTVINVGDSRAVLCRGGEALALSEDHKPDRADERTRIEVRSFLF